MVMQAFWPFQKRHFRGEGCPVDFHAMVLAGLVALVLGALAARRLPVGGLVIVLVLVLAVAILRILLGFAHPTILETVVLVALVQAGYLGGAFANLRHPARKAPSGIALGSDQKAG